MRDYCKFPVVLLLLVSVFALVSCSSNEVASSGIIQKRKHQKGFYFSGFNNSKKLEKSVANSVLSKEPEHLTKSEKLDFAIAESSEENKEVSQAKVENSHTKSSLSAINAKLAALSIDSKSNSKLTSKVLEKTAKYFDGIEPDKEQTSSSKRGKTALWLGILANLIPILGLLFIAVAPGLFFLAYLAGLVLAVAAMLVGGPIRKTDNSAKGGYILGGIFLVQFLISIVLLVLLIILVIAALSP